MLRVDGGYTGETIQRDTTFHPERTEQENVCSNESGADSKFGFLSFTESLFKLRANIAAPQVAPVQTASVTPDEQKQIDDGVNKVFQTAGNGYGNATVELSNQLENKSDTYQAQFMKTLYTKTGATFTDQLLRIAGGEMPHYISDARPTDENKQVIASALGKAYDQGALDKDFVGKILNWESKTLPPGNDYSGNLVAKSGSRELMRTYADQALALYNNKSWETSSFISGAGKAMAGDPQLLQEKLAELKRDGKLEDFVKNLNPSKFNVPYYEEYDNALANIVTTAARIQPPTGEVLSLFQTVASTSMDVKGMPEAMTKLYTGGYTEYLRWPNGKIEDTVFHSNAEFFLHQLTAVGDGHDALAATALTKFFEKTVFNDKFSDREVVAAVTAREIKSLQYAVENYPNVDSRTKQIIDSTTHASTSSSENHDYQIKEQLAFRLGRVTGAVFQGFERAVAGRKSDNEKVDAAVDFVFEIVPIDKAKDAAGKVPGVGTVANLTAGKAIDKGKEALKNWLHGRDLNKDREDVYNKFMEVANTISSDLYDEYSGGREDIAGISRDLADK